MPDSLQQPLFHEDLAGALNHLISALGGPKKVGSAMWPSITNPEKAGRKLSDCLNDNHLQKFSPDDVMWLLREGRKAGIHSAMAFINEECGYAAPQPVDPENEAAALQRQFIQSVKQQAEMLKRMERLSLPTIKAVI